MALRSRALGSVITIALAVTATPTLAAPSVAASTTSMTSTASMRLDEGARHWKATPEKRARVVSAPHGRRGSAVKVRTTRPGTTSLVTRARVGKNVEQGTRFVGKVWVKGTRKGQKAALHLREWRHGKRIQVRRKAVRLRTDKWSVIRVGAVKKHRMSRFGLRVVAPQLRTKQAVKVDGASVAPVASTSQASDSGQKLSNGCSYTTRGIPSCGAYFGSAYGSNTEPSDFEKTVGQRLGVRRTYYNGTQVAKAVATAKSDLSKGRLPWMSFKLPYSWTDMANGRGDAWTKDLVAKLNALDGPVWLAFHHEPEADGNMSEWTRMQKHLGPIVRSNSDNVAFTLILTGWNQLYGAKGNSLDASWPKTKVDVAGFDVYNKLGTVKNGKEQTKATKMATDYFAKFSVWAKKHDVVWGLAETGYTNKAAEQDPDWIKRTYGELVANGGVAFAYFNTTLNSIAPWDLGTPAKMRAWKRAYVGTPLLPAH